MSYDPAVSFLGIHPMEMKSLSWRDIYMRMFLAALIVAKYETIQVNKENGIFFNLKNEVSPEICDNMIEPGEHFAKWNMPHRERQILYGIIYMRNLKKKFTLIKKKWRGSQQGLRAGKIGRSW